MADELSEEVSSLLRCPETQQKLRRVSSDELSSFEGDFPEGGFLTEDGSRLYPIRDAFPILTPEECVTAES